MPLFIAGYLLLARPTLRAFARALAAFCAGGALVPLCAVANALFFGSLAGVSAGEASDYDHRVQLVVHAWSRALHGVWLDGGDRAPLGLVALWLLVKSDARTRPAALHRRTRDRLSVHLLRNQRDERLDLLRVYAFPFVPATIAALAFICERWAPLVSGRWRLVAATLLVALAPALALAITFSTDRAGPPPTTGSRQ